MIFLLRKKKDYYPKDPSLSGGIKRENEHSADPVIASHNDPIGSSSQSSEDRLKAELFDKINTIEALKKDLESNLNEIKRLESRYSEVYEANRYLATDHRRKDKQIERLGKELEVAKSRIQELESYIDQKESAISELLAEMNKSLSQREPQVESSKWHYEDFEHLNRTRMVLESYNNNLRNELAIKERELLEIKNSVIYRIVRRIANMVEAAAPPRTGRRRIVNSIRRAAGADQALTQKRESKPFAENAASELQNSQLERSNATISDAMAELKKVENIDPNAWLDQILSPREAMPTTDRYLRDFMKWSSHDVTKLEDYPLISIIIPTYKNLEDMRRNVESIEEKTTYPNYEIIIVTNNQDAQSPMRKYLATLKHKVYVYDKEYSFAGVNNFGATRAKGDLFLFLNDDTEVSTPHWLEALVKLISYPTVGAVGGKLIYPDGSLQEAGGIVWGDGNAWNYGKFAFSAEDPNVNFVREVDYCSGAFLMVKSHIFKEVGGFDERYFPAYWEDADLCFSIREKGFSVLYQPLSVIIHKEGATQGTDTSKGIKSYQVTNQEKFIAKWKHRFAGRLTASQQNAFKERSRRKGKRILYIDHYAPTPDKDAGSLLTFNTLGILSWLGHDITFWPENLYHSEPYVTELQQKGIEVIYGPNSFEEFFSKRGKEFDLVIMSRPHISIKFIDAILRIRPDIKIIYETHDLGYLRLYRQALVENRPELVDEARSIKRIELRLAKASTFVFVRSRKEGIILKNEDSSINPVVLPLIHVPIKKINSFESRKNIIFVGGYVHPPNVDAARFLTNEIFPLVRDKIKGIKLFLVGSNPPEAVTQLASNDITVTGYVEDLTEYLQSTRIMVAPLRYGSGMKGKITESMINGLPVVTTSIGAEGMDLKDRESVLLAETPEEFAERIIDLYNNENLWNKISTNSNELALKRYSPENIRDFLQALVSSDSSIRSLQYSYG